MTKVAIILSGSGVFDGSELHETVLTFLALEKLGIKYETFAPNVEQFHCVDHSKGESTDETRNVLIESNRVSRGSTKNLSDLNDEYFDSLVFVGGFGAAKNLSDFAINGKGYAVNAEIEKTIKTFHKSEKWILAMCISPVLLARTINNCEITIGSDKETISILPDNSEHIDCKVDQYHIDESNRLITTPAYMLASNLIELERGITNSLEALKSKLS